MGHPHLDVFAVKTQMFGAYLPHVLSINITVYAFERFESLQPMDNVDVAEISGMPDFVTCFKISKDSVVEIAMCVRKESYVLHVFKKLRRRVLTVDDIRR